MNDVSPFTFYFLPPEVLSDFAFESFSGEPDPFFDGSSPLEDFIFVGEAAVIPFLGPFSRLLRAYFIAYSLVKQSQIPSQAIIMKSCSGLIWTFLMSGKEET